MGIVIRHTEMVGNRLEGRGTMEKVLENTVRDTQIAKRTEAFGAVDVVERKKERKKCLSVCLLLYSEASFLCCYLSESFDFWSCGWSCDNF